LFQGTSSLALDDKGRFAMPARYRDRLLEICGGKLVVTLNPQDKSLLVYPDTEWRRVVADIQARANTNPAIRRLSQVLIGSAHEYEMTAQGRVQIPANLRDRVGLDREAALVGQINKFELWDERAWNEFSEASLAKSWEGSDAIDAFDGLSL
jgi:MraZ protein